MKRLFVVGLALLGAGCIRPPLTAPREGGATWLALESAHFIVYTDVGEGRARAAQRELERIYLALEGVAFPRRSAFQPTRVEIMIFDRDRDYSALALAGSGGYWMPGTPNDPEAHRMMVIDGALEPTSRRILTHELTHDFELRSLGYLPPWLCEGLAEYYETMEVRSDVVMTGAPAMSFRNDPVFNSAHRVGYAPGGDLPSADWLLGADQAAFMVSWTPTHDEERRRGLNYAGAWALVSMLMDQRYPYRANFQDYVGRLAGGESSKVAWATAFAGVSMTSIDNDLAQRVMANPATEVEHPFHAASLAASTSERVLADFEVHLLWSRLGSWIDSSPRGRRARAQLDLAVAEAPASPEVLYYEGAAAVLAKRNNEARIDYEQASASDPKNPRYLYPLLTLALQEGKADEIEVRAEALQRFATSPDQFALVAAARLSQGHADEAIAMSAHGARIASSCRRCLVVLAEARHAKGDLDGAIVAARRAIAASGHGLVDSGLDRLLARYLAERAAVVTH